MFTAAESVIEYRGLNAFPDRLNRRQHDHYAGYAEKMLDIYTAGPGLMRFELHNLVRALFREEDDCPSGRIRAFCKLLDDAGQYAETNGAAIRRLQSYVDPAAKCMNKTELFSDHPHFVRLESFDGFESPLALLSRYNVAQLQAALLRAEYMTVELHSDYKRAIRNINLAQLLHDITPLPGSGYRLELSGPLSPFRSTSRYGSALARFLPSLLTCGMWNMTATLLGPWSVRVSLEISNNDKYNCHIEPEDEFDSAVEEDFAEAFGESREGWELVREAEILHRGQKIFIPDFLLRHSGGAEVLLEIAGFWTPEYLQEKKRTLEIFSDRRILIALPEATLNEYGLPPAKVIAYKTRLEIEPVIKRLRGLIHNEP
jgi:predicted nuclease of restriction endonuclease-like RecB superfamily